MLPAAMFFPVVALGAFLLVCGAFMVGRSAGNPNVPQASRQKPMVIGSLPETPGLILVLSGLLSAPLGQRVTAVIALAGAIAAGGGAGFVLSRGSE